jgi:divalent metal cation (Fe/Co/Zn/Cd) transporter
MSPEEDNWRGYEWTALSVTTVGGLLASIQGSALLFTNSAAIVTDAFRKGRVGLGGG